ncbi:hypothetical protein [Clostridium beijerinckii]|uniref:hypothetical protein n=1 Tax=Clostridium beijerinckii TaxID=1520 RepID=UPI0009CA181D|nr:hypothetical protein [Clostridium beijerinckii]NRT78413.1 hypothetical protein [Clostridium beijerinckii]OOM47294.1 hypothetical protein CBEIJ_28600 [Clostridium beijerinckii]
MDKVNSKIILNIEIEDIELISKLNIFSQELSISLNNLVLESIKKLIYDIEFIRL